MKKKRSGEQIQWLSAKQSAKHMDPCEETKFQSPETHFQMQIMATLFPFAHGRFFVKTTGGAYSIRLVFHDPIAIDGCFLDLCPDSWNPMLFGLL